MRIIFEQDGVKIVDRDDKFYIQYDAGTHQVVMREDEISEDDKNLILIDSENIIRVLEKTQPRVIERGEAPNRLKLAVFDIEKTHCKLSQAQILIKIERYFNELKEGLPLINNRPQNIGFELRGIRKILGYASVTTDFNSIYRIFEHLTTFGIALFESKVDEDSLNEMHIEGQVIQFTSSKEYSYCDSDVWLSVFWSAVISRNNECVERITSIPERIFSKSTFTPDLFDLALVELMKALFDENADLIEIFNKINHAVEFESFSVERMNYIFLILEPVINVIRPILTGEKEEYEAAMEDALRKHIKYWSKENEYDSLGFWSLPLTASAIFAIDTCGFELSFKSEYLPDYLINFDS
jgi:hypothetical protein